MSETRGRPFQPGNTFGRGRPRGSRNKNTLALQQMLAEHGEALVSKCVVAALQGDMLAMRLCIERLLPALRHNPVQVALPPVRNAMGVGRALEQLVQNVAQGQITPGEAERIANILKIRGRSVRDEDVEKQMGGALDLVPGSGRS
jgi:hypothetical protein